MISKPPKDQPAILIYDIETAPALAWMWSAYQANIIDIEQDWYLLSFAYKWAGSNDTFFVSIFQDPAFKPDTDNDLYVVKRLHKLFDLADITVAHNGDRFDRKKANARFLFHDLGPPSYYQTIDTLKGSRRQFSNYRNSLADLGRQYTRTEKGTHEGFSLWRECMRGDPEAWKRMEAYNRQDIVVLEKLYSKLIPWMDESPNLALVGDRPEACPRCGKEAGFHSRGVRRTKTRKYRQWRCKACKGYSSSRISEKDGIPVRK